ncbi:adhesin isopeptide-forming family sspB-C2 type protein [Bifidobacterium commune]|uniref:Adhesin isopeptide-forming domain-containing protein, sspB-C2 type n=1 Tax=Bifidobacterium commune TaxID=1505727 RepID=A0A1C4H5B4_9BIFI|nr:LPXTG cell wall anchor domain-containing protein [Bifidobacterium commune]MBB2955793.1 adhesin isopeptide-forming family sspB-C2 type protein [Bifidobacterium commune]SCC80065.1 adhesin isopeptide-forming domain-containing protein, sspB-C2 type [Bifidobacterium commune]
MRFSNVRAGVFRRLLAGAVVGLTAVAMLAPSMANADGGAGSGGSGGANGGRGAIKWTYRDSFGTPSDALVTDVLRGMGMSVTGGDADIAINQAMSGAVGECQARYGASHPGQAAQANCRLVSVGAIYTPTAGNSFTGHPAGFTSNQWATAWNAETQGKIYSHGGVSYLTSSPFSDGSTTINSLVAREASRNVALIVVVLSQDEPPVDVPPAPPSKDVQRGVSADAMVNRTTVTSGTGTNGREFSFSDSFDAHGQSYTVSNQKVFDVTTGRDISDRFAFDTADGSAPAGDVAHATWKGGDRLPDGHTWRWTLDVTVHGPSTSKVDDTARVHWKGAAQTADQDTPSRSFPTWKPSPDKSWVRRDDSGKWLAVVDPTHSNATGADDMTFLDGDTVGSVVNGTVDAHLIDAPSVFSLEDDWSKAGYLVGAAKASDVRVYEADAQVGANGHYERSSVNDIANTGRDVTGQFDISLNGSKAVAKAKPSYLAKLKGMATPLQVTMLVPMGVDYANGKGAAKVREDFGKEPGDEVAFCTNPDGSGLTNAGSETVNTRKTATNEPKVCGYVPPAKKDVVGEASQGGDQSSVDGKAVYPGQKVEYQLDTQPHLPSLAYPVKTVTLTDRYDRYLQVDKQTLEIMDLNTGHAVPKSKYTTTWDDKAHMVAANITDPTLIAQWQAGGAPRLQLRFEGTVAKDAPADHKVNNRWVLTLNNSLTPSNEVFNIPPSLNPAKHDNQSAKQGDPKVSIDGRTLLLGDTGNYVIDLDATQSNPAYKVWRLGIVDDFDERYLKVDPSAVSVTGDDGRDYTGRFNIQVRDGVLYAFAKRVDTKVPATGETVKGDPQPADLKAYSESNDYDPLNDPAIDQTLLGQKYHVTLPYTVAKVTDGYVVRNKATQVQNTVRKDTNEVSNPLKPINPAKDVVVKVGGESVDGTSIYRDHVFLYRLDSSVLPANRAYPKTDRWRIADRLDPAYDQYTGQWAVYAARDLYRDGKVVAGKGERIAGSGFDSSKLGGDMFAMHAASDGTLNIEATAAYLALVSADNGHEQGWRAYVQAKRVKVTDRHENRFTETINDRDSESNVVWTRTPDMTPGLHIEKWDRDSGWPDGDRDESKDAKKLWRDGDTIVFTITNTSNNEGGQGAVYKAGDLKLEDRTIAGDGTVTDLKYPDNWDTLVLRPGEHVDVTGTLKGVTGHHTDRAKVTGTPLVECPVPAGDPFDASKKNNAQQPAPADGMKRVRVGDRTLCADTKVESNQDDWNATRASMLARTGSAVLAVVLAALLLAGAGFGLMYVRSRSDAVAPNADGGEER